MCQAGGRGLAASSAGAVLPGMAVGLSRLTLQDVLACVSWVYSKGLQQENETLCFTLRVKMLITDKQQADWVPSCPLAEQFGQQIWQL